MEADRIDRMVSQLRARDVMAHRTETGVYSFGIRVVIGDGSEAVWTPGGAAGLDAQVIRDGVLVGCVPHIPGSEGFTDEQTVEAIATALYSEEGLYPADRAAPQPPPAADSPTGPAAPGPGGRPGPGAGGPPRRPWLRHKRDFPR